MVFRGGGGQDPERRPFSPKRITTPPENYPHTVYRGRDKSLYYPPPVTIFQR